MATAASLEEAANQASANLFGKWITNQLKTSTATFANAVLAIFDQQAPNSHPATNWATLLVALSRDMSATVNSILLEEQVTAVQYVYRLCLMVSALNVQVLITGPQAAAVLTAYNAAF